MDWWNGRGCSIDFEIQQIHWAAVVLAKFRQADIAGGSAGIVTTNLNTINYDDWFSIRLYVVYPIYNLEEPT